MELKLLWNDYCKLRRGSITPKQLFTIVVSCISTIDEIAQAMGSNTVYFHHRVIEMIVQFCIYTLT